MLYVCVRGVLDVVSSICNVTRGAVGAGVWEVWAFRYQMLYVCVLWASCGSSQLCIMHGLPFVNAGRGCKRRPYGRGILQSSHDYFIGRHECLLLFTPSCCCECFIICSGLCACTEMLWLYVLYVSFGSKVRSTTFGCVAMGSAVLFIFCSEQSTCCFV